LKKKQALAHSPSRIEYPMIIRILMSGVLFVASCGLLYSKEPSPAAIPVRYTEGLVHGFLILRSLDGKVLADGDVQQSSSGDRVTARLVFHFKDGSIHDETTVFSQHHTFRLQSYHLIQKGPTFEHPSELVIDGASGQVTVRYTDDGKEKTETEHLKLPPDVANGLALIFLKNRQPDAPQTTVSMVASTPKLRLVKLILTRQGEDQFLVVGTKRTATHYAVKVDIGGVAGAVAPLVGKQPPDTQVWILGGDAPVLVRSEGPLFAGGPVWQIELTSPVWPPQDNNSAHETAKDSKR
jgi:hypothetical protein